MLGMKFKIGAVAAGCLKLDDAQARAEMGVESPLPGVYRAPVGTVELRRSGHWRLLGPNGETIWAPQTPRGERAALRLRAALRRSGVEVP